ncbi:MAG: M1 family peptidase, partial [Saprospiraceae bacterium]
MKKRNYLLLLWSSASFVFFALGVNAQEKQDKFAQMYDLLPTPNTYRTASGSPGHEYWQQQADYVMSIELDDEKQRLYGIE